MGWGAGTFLSTYNDNRKDASEALLEDSPVASVVLDMSRQGINLSCKPTELYSGLMKTVGSRLGPNWPKSIGAFGNELRRIAPQLRLHGIAVTFERKGGDRVVTLKSDGIGQSGTVTGLPKP